MKAPPDVHKLDTFSLPKGAAETVAGSFPPQKKPRRTGRTLESAALALL